MEESFNSSPLQIICCWLIGMPSNRANRPEAQFEIGTKSIIYNYGEISRPLYHISSAAETV